MSYHFVQSCFGQEVVLFFCCVICLLKLELSTLASETCVPASADGLIVLDDDEHIMGPLRAWPARGSFLCAAACERQLLAHGWLPILASNYFQILTFWLFPLQWFWGGMHSKLEMLMSYNMYIYIYVFIYNTWILYPYTINSLFVSYRLWRHIQSH
jgi:hypothetical protein